MFTLSLRMCSVKHYNILQNNEIRYKKYGNIFLKKFNYSKSIFFQTAGEFFSYWAFVKVSSLISRFMFCAPIYVQCFCLSVN